MEEKNLIFLDNPSLETERLVLRKLTMSDAEDIFKYASDPVATKFMTFDTHKTLEDSKGVIKYFLDKYEKDEAGEWGIELRASKALIGTFGVVVADQKNSCVTIGYILNRDHWGKGFMTETLKRIIKFVFDDMDYNRIEAVHYIGNEASGRVMQKAGMQFEGVIRQKLYTKGEYRDVKQYAIVKDDYLAK